MSKRFLSQTSIKLSALLATMTPEQLKGVTNAELAKKCGVHPRTVGRGLKELQDRRLVLAERRPPNFAGAGSDPTGRTLVWIGTSVKS